MLNSCVASRIFPSISKASKILSIFKKSTKLKLSNCRPISLISNIDKILERLIGSSRPEVFLRKCVLKICSKFAGEHPCRSVISINLFCNLIEIEPRHGCSAVHLLHIFRTPFLRNTSTWLLLTYVQQTL